MSQHEGLPHDFVPEFKPGDKMVFEMSINIMFESKLIEYQLEKMIDMVDGVEKLIKAFKAVETGVKAFDKLTSTVTKCVNAIDDFTPSITDSLSEKAKLFNTLRNQLYGLTSAYGTTGNKTADAALKLANSGLDGVYTAIFEDPEQWFNNTSVEEMKKIVDNTKALTENITSSSSTTSKFNVFDSMRTVISAIPVRFALRRVFMIEDEDNTTSIPWSYSTTHAGPQYFGVSNVSKYLYSIFAATAGDYISDQLPWYLHLIPGVDDALNVSDAKEYIRATEAEIARVQAKDATGKITWKAYIISAEQNVADNITLSSDNETAAYENGVLTFTGPGMIEITPASTENGTLIIENSEGYTYTYEVEVVEAHECVAGKQETIISPTVEDDGFAVQCCEICGDVMDIVILEHDMCKEHSFSKWTSELDAICSIGGIKTRECTVCGYVETVFIDANGHNEETRNKVKATCTKDGYTGDVYCTVCDELILQGEVIKASGHDYVIEETSATCLTAGYTTHSCTVCGDSYTGDYTEALGHTGGTATCCDKAVCTRCGEEYGELNENNHTGHSEYTQAASCTVNGYRMVNCPDCGAELEYEALAKLGHSFTVFVSEQAGDCITKSSVTYKCSRCDATEVLEGEYGSHDYSEAVTAPTCTGQGFTTFTCTVCGDSYIGDYTEALGHTWGAWSTQTEATVFRTGLKERFCTAQGCDGHQQEIIPMLVKDEAIDEDTGISVFYDDENYETNVDVVIEEVFDGSQYLIKNYEKNTAFNIKTYVNGAQAQPSGAVTVKIPLPAGYNQDKTFVYHINSETGEREKMRIEIVDGYVYFETGSFSIYIIVDESTEIQEKECSCACHSDSFFSRIFWKLKVFFWKLFGAEKKRECECGEMHW